MVYHTKGVTSDSTQAVVQIMFMEIPANNDPWFHMFCEWIHKFNWLNSREFTGLCEHIWCVDTCLPWNHEFSTWWHVPVKSYQFWPRMTRDKLVQNLWQKQNRCIHVNTHENTYRWSGTNYEPVWHVPIGLKNGSLFAGIYLDKMATILIT